ncbi:MAG: hypothetical protein IID45_04470 [Planctomycetes bacterium]|nr:hypothetical protein [Planctomycetota bacterium]
MRIIILKSPGALTLLGTLIVTATGTAADRVSPTGIVRISDIQRPIAEPGPLPRFISLGTVFSAPSATGGYCSECNAGCNGGDCFNGQRGRGRKCFGCCRLLTSMICPCAGCTHSPDHGWSRPAKHPVVRIPVVYRRYWPSKWYGEPGAGMPANARRFPRDRLRAHVFQH